MFFSHFVSHYYKDGIRKSHILDKGKEEEGRAGCQGG